MGCDRWVVTYGEKKKTRMGSVRLCLHILCHLTHFWKSRLEACGEAFHDHRALVPEVTREPHAEHGAVQFGKVRAPGDLDFERLGVGAKDGAKDLLALGDDVDCILVTGGVGTGLDSGLRWGWVGVSILGSRTDKWRVGAGGVPPQ